MVDTLSKDAKRKLKTPTPFFGKREDLRKFLQEIKIYLMANSDAYPDDLDKTRSSSSYPTRAKAMLILGRKNSLIQPNRPPHKPRQL